MKPKTPRSRCWSANIPSDRIIYSTMLPRLWYRLQFPRMRSEYKTYFVHCYIKKIYDVKTCCSSGGNSFRGKLSIVRTAGLRWTPSLTDQYYSSWWSKYFVSYLFAGPAFAYIRSTEKITETHYIRSFEIPRGAHIIYFSLTIVMLSSGGVLMFEKRRRATEALLCIAKVGVYTISLTFPRWSNKLKT